MFARQHSRRGIFSGLYRPGEFLHRQKYPRAEKYFQGRVDTTSQEREQKKEEAD
jgi:hypothetical protein